MPRPTEIQNIIEEAVAEVFDAALPKLRAEIVRRAVEVVESLAPAPGASPSDLLNAAAASIHESGSQAEILRHLLEGEARFAGRVALFVVKGATRSTAGRESALKTTTPSRTLSCELIGSGLVGRGDPGACSGGRFGCRSLMLGLSTAMKAPAENNVWCCRWWSKTKWRP